VDGVVALGGGVVGDLAGFAAATIYRGVALFQIPTSLLAQLDSGIGGKTGVDLPQGKNLVGAFYAPRLTLIDPDCLTTLPRRQFCAGAAEAIKCGLIADAALLEKLEQKAPDWETVIADSCAVKAKFVLADEHDHGDRRKLNFGHTLGHVYEAAGGYQRWYHGEAVAAGMAAMLRIEEKNDAAAGALRERVEKLLQAYGLPIRISCTAEEYRRYLAVDKKCSGGDITVVTVHSAGAAQVHTLPVSALLQQLEESDGH
jgi:3-dehydroquinate synthase